MISAPVAMVTHAIERLVIEVVAEVATNLDTVVSG